MLAPPPRQLPPDVMLCLSHLRWDLVFQRPHHLLTRACRDFRVVFCEEPLFEAEAESGLRLRWRGEVLVATPVFAPGTDNVAELVAEQLGELVESLEPRRLVAWYYTPMALPLGRDLPADCVVYDCMDELSLFKNAPHELRRLEGELMQSADLLFTGGASLFEAKRDAHLDAHCFPSSIDAAHFGRARAATRIHPPDQAAIPHPRIGYFGVIDERLDIALLHAVAAAKPSWHFVMIGPVVKIDAADLPKAPNIHWLGARDYADLPDYLGGWDAGFMPFALNDSTRFISPTKTPEFLAAGVPVVSTPVRDVVRSYGADGLVPIAAGPIDMVAALEGALRSRQDPDRLAAVDRKLADLSWDRTWAAMLALIRGKLDLATPAAAPAREPAHV